MGKPYNRNNSLLTENVRPSGSGSLLTFIIGLVLLGAGILILLQKVQVQTSMYTWHIGSTSIPGGIIVVPLLLSLGYLFFRGKSVIGWICLIVSALFIIVTLVLSVRLSLERTSLLGFLLIFGSIAAGIGLTLRALFGGSNKKQ